MLNAFSGKSIFNRLFYIVLIAVIVLVVLFILISSGKDKALDTRYPYFSEAKTYEAFSRAETFAENLVVSDADMPLEGVQLNEDTEIGLLFNVDSNKPVFAQKIYTRAYPASITKVMTALLVMEYGNMDEVVVMQESDFALEEGSQNSGLMPGDTLTMEQLFKTLLIYSANDAAIAIARVIDGSTEAFVEHMNQKAKSLGMLDTHFANPHGLHQTDHYTCAYDIYLMMNEAMKYTAFTDTVRMNVYTLYATHADGSAFSLRLDSTDKFLTGEKPVPQGVVLWGGKTGTTDEAGACLTLIAQNEKGIPYIAVILNAYNKTALYRDMTQLLTKINTEAAF